MSTMRFVVALVVVLIAGCNGGPTPPTEILSTVVPPPSVGDAGASPSPTHQVSGARVVVRADYKAWPFVADSGTLACTWFAGRPVVTFTPAGGKKYGLSGAARDEGFPKVTKKVLKKYPNLSTMQPVIDDGLKICGYTP